MIRETDTENTRSLAMSWCQIGLHGIFASAGEAGNGKLERQLISYHLLVSNVGLAHQMLENMTFMQKNNRSSRYLAYCVAIRTGNDADAQSCLNTITNGQGENDKLLFACIGESIKYGRLLNTACLALRLLEKQLQDQSLDLDLGVLLQYTAAMFLQVVARWPSGQALGQEIPSRLCSIFKHATRFHGSHNAAAGHSSWPKFNVGWFQKSSFNLASTYAKTWPRRYIIDVLDCCRQLCEPQDGVLTDIILTKENSDRLHGALFMQAVLYTSEARALSVSYSIEDLPESSYDGRSKPKTSECRVVLYRNVFRIFTTLRKRFTDTKSFDADSSKTLKPQLHVLIPLAFEALLFLNVNLYSSVEASFDELSIRQYLQTVNDLEPPMASYAVLADTLLEFAANNGDRGGLRLPALAAARLLSKIIQALREAQSYNTTQAARWIRCVAQLLFEDIDELVGKSETKEPPKTTQHLSMLDCVTQQAINLAKAAPIHSKQEANVGAQRAIDATNKDLHQYPEEEVQWLATKLWNMAIDFHGIAQHETAKVWAHKAVQMAEVVAEHGGSMAGFVDQLKHNIRSLGWDI